MENEEINKKLDLIIEAEGYDISEWKWAITFLVLFVLLYIPEIISRFL